jgi:hypothetical protein
MERRGHRGENPVKVTLKTFGGFAPGLLPRARVVESSRLDAHRAERFEKLVAQVHGAQATERAPDERRYELAIEDCGECRTVRCADSTMTASFADLIAFIQAHGDHAG